MENKEILSIEVDFKKKEVFIKNKNNEILVKKESIPGDKFNYQFELSLVENNEKGE